jgi:hypothetical protein
MTTSRRRQRTDKPRPNDFHESLSPVLPSVPLYPLGSRALPSSFTRYGLIVLWVLIVVLAGIGIGLAIKGIGVTAQTSASPYPIAAQTLTVRPVTGPALTHGASASSKVMLTVAPAASVDQVNTPDVWKMALQAAYQPAAGPQSLAPGFTNYGLGQGGSGTDPVRR